MHADSVKTASTIGPFLWALEVPPAPGRAATMSDYRRIATAAETAGADFLIATGTTSRFGFLEPVPVLTALSIVTERIGLVADVSTNFTYPYNTARRLSALDRMSDGRGGWRPVVDGPPAAGYGLPDEPHDIRVARRDELLTVVADLWHSWGSDALLLDRASGFAYDAQAIHPIDHAGRFFQVSGPADQPRSPQGRPVLVNSEHPATWSEEVTRLVDVLIVESDVVDAWSAAAAVRLEAEGRARADIRVLARTGLDPESTVDLARLAAISDGFSLVTDLSLPAPDVVFARWTQALAAVGISRPAATVGTLRTRLGLPIPPERATQRRPAPISSTRSEALA
ncbi:LLM class flavin-dependent oxidoreductase [Rhodococcus opacus]|uniref:Luciferase-like domain-containing protein n=1 Tax=Rhodococcus opacus TaxID=37919 RepID=A0A2S8J8Q7_RHOOP|nr:LLM class flavin-dependent oxidoreductase [Rhodococcus opacus]PQP23377.1 hypothetical protein C5613_18630 [Rhodococcus opacus]